MEAPNPLSFLGTVISKRPGTDVPDEPGPKKPKTKTELPDDDDLAGGAPDEEEKPKEEPEAEAGKQPKKKAKTTEDVLAEQEGKVNEAGSCANKQVQV